jgi:hypothetical protein
VLVTEIPDVMNVVVMVKLNVVIAVVQVKLMMKEKLVTIVMVVVK